MSTSNLYLDPLKKNMKGIIIIIVIMISMLIAVLIAIYKKLETYISLPQYSQLPYYAKTNDTTNASTDASTNDTTHPISFDHHDNYDTIARDVLDRVDCNRIARIKYQSPAHKSDCGNYSSQQYGSPALKYPIMMPV